MTFWQWLEMGKAAGWCSDLVCGTHDTTPMTPAEAAAWEEGGDPCVWIVRVYDPLDVAQALDVTP